MNTDYEEKILREVVASLEQETAEAKKAYKAAAAAKKKAAKKKSGNKVTRFFKAIARKAKKAAAWVWNKTKAVARKSWKALKKVGGALAKAKDKLAKNKVGKKAIAVAAFLFKPVKWVGQTVAIAVQKVAAGGVFAANLTGLVAITVVASAVVLVAGAFSTTYKVLQGAVLAIRSPFMKANERAQAWSLWRAGWRPRNFYPLSLSEIALREVVRAADKAKKPKPQEPEQTSEQKAEDDAVKAEEAAVAKATAVLSDNPATQKKDRPTPKQKKKRPAKPPAAPSGEVPF